MDGTVALGGCHHTSHEPQGQLGGASGALCRTLEMTQSLSRDGVCQEQEPRQKVLVMAKELGEVERKPTWQ